MQQTIGIYTLLLEMNQLVIRKNGETIKAIEVPPDDAVDRFNQMVLKLKAER